MCNTIRDVVFGVSVWFKKQIVRKRATFVNISITKYICNITRHPKNTN